MPAAIAADPPPGALCVDVFAMDVAGVRSAPGVAACATIEDPDPDPPDGGAGHKDKPAAGCAGSPAGALAALLALVRRRTRRSQRRH